MAVFVSYRHSLPLRAVGNRNGGQPPADSEGSDDVLFFLGMIPVIHDFWSVGDPEQRQPENDGLFLKNATLFDAALVFVALSGTVWPYALNVGL